MRARDDKGPFGFDEIRVLPLRSHECPCMGIDLRDISVHIERLLSRFPVLAKLISRFSIVERLLSNDKFLLFWIDTQFPEVATVLLTLTLPRINAYMTTALVDTIHAAEGNSLAIGAKLLDLVVDLSAAAPHDCPPIMCYRIVLRERVWLRRLVVASGDNLEVGATIARFSTEPDEPLAGEPARGLRVSVAGIIGQSNWWSAGRP